MQIQRLVPEPKYRSDPFSAVPFKNSKKGGLNQCRPCMIWLQGLHRRHKRRHHVRLLDSGGVDNDAEVLGGAWRDEIAREEIVFGFAHLERVLVTRISFLKPLLADRVWNIK